MSLVQNSLLRIFSLASIVGTALLVSSNGWAAEPTSMAQKNDPKKNLLPGLGDESSDKALIAESTDVGLPKTQAHEFATIPEGKTLPKNVLRSRFVYGSTSSTGKSYDNDGNKDDSFVKVKATGGALVLEYGLSSTSSLQIQQDFVNNYEVSVDRSSSAFSATREGVYAAQTGGAKNRDELIASLAAKLAKNDTIRPALCGAASVEACYGAILVGSAANNTSSTINVPLDPNDATKILPIPAGSTGATVKGTLEAFATQVDSQVDQGINQVLSSEVEKKGGTGLADTTIAGLWELYDDKSLAVSVGGGIRFPTGNRDRSAGEERTGRGLTEIGTRYNVDYKVIDSVAVAWQHQQEMMLDRGSYKVAGTKVFVERKGLRNLGFLVVKPSLAGLSDSLRMFGPKLGISYDYDSEERKRTSDTSYVTTKASSHELKYLANLTMTLFDFGLPLQLETEYKKSFAGKNVAVATDSMLVQLKGFYRF